MTPTGKQSLQVPAEATDAASVGCAAPSGSVVAWFAVADIGHSEDGWFGPHGTKEGAVRDMLSNWGGDQLTQCLVARGYPVTEKNYPDLFEDGESISEWDWQVERPYEVYPLNDQVEMPKP